MSDDDVRERIVKALSSLCGGEETIVILALTAAKQLITAGAGLPHEGIPLFIKFVSDTVNTRRPTSTVTVVPARPPSRGDA